MSDFPASTPLPPSSRVRAALGLFAASVQQFLWGYWQAPPGH